MFNSELLESSEFYNKRYGSFTSKIIYPLLLFIIFIIILLCFTTKEITVKSIGTIYPKSSLAIIQSTSNNPIIKNNMKEGKEVSKNDILVKFKNTSITGAKDLVNSKLNKNESKLSSLYSLKNSIIQNQNLISSDVYGYESRFNEYMAQMLELDLSNKQEKYTINENPSDNTKKTNQISLSNKLLNSHQSSLKAKTLASINAEISELDDNFSELNAKKIDIDTENDNQIIKSPAKGILHLKNNNVNTTYFPLGTNIAEIYPDLNKNTPLIIEFFVPTYSMNNIKKGQKIRFRASQEGPKPININGEIKKIDTAATESNKGNFYKVVASINPTNKERKNIRYGLSGNISVITGKKTWMNYIKDLIYK